MKNKQLLPLSQFTPGTQGFTLTEMKPGAAEVRTDASGGFMQLTGEAGQVGGADWRTARFFTMDVRHECHDVLVIVATFYRNHGKHINDRIEVHFGVLPGVETRLCFPLSALNSEKLFLSRYPGTMQTVLRGGAGFKQEEINLVTIGTVESVSPRRFTISQAALIEEEPDFPTPRVELADELGQYTGKEWPGKTGSPEELIRYLQEEEQREENSLFYRQEWARFGGWKRLRFEGSGFFRTQHDGKRWWLVDPDGYAFLSTGLDCMIPGETMKTDGMEHLTSWLPPETGAFRDAWKKNDGREGRYFSYAIANLIRAFGEGWQEAWARITKRRQREWGFNTVANWSQTEYIRSAQMPYVWPLTAFPSTEKLIFRDFPDVFSEEYERNAEAYAEQLRPFAGDPLLIGYFMRNEPQWAFIDNLNITEKLLEHEGHFHSRDRFAAFIRSRYDDSLERWNEAWNSEFGGFDRLLAPLPNASALSEQAAADLDAFNRLLTEQYVRIPALACKKTDPNHLNLGMRYAWISSDHLLAGSELFDVFSINTYQMKPDVKGIEEIADKTGLPVMIGEFHHGAADVGMLANGIRGVRTQKDRGNAYRYFVEAGAACPHLVGMHYFILNDQALLGRFDGENYQIGAVDVCHRPYEPFIEGVMEAHSSMYEVAAGEREPYSVPPEEIPRTGF